MKRESFRKTWDLDGLPPREIVNARSIAGKILADAKHGRKKSIVETLGAENLDLEQTIVILGALDLANGNTALMLAAKNGHVDCCQLLVERGADLSARNRHGETSIDVALAAGHAEVVTTLKACVKQKELITSRFGKASPLPGQQSFDL